MQQVALGMILVMASSPALQSAPANLLAGRRLADEYCATCHSTGASGSPLPNAPPFRELFKRYPAGGLDALLREGMLAPAYPPEEGGSLRHPHMPLVQLDDDQRRDLREFLRSLEPK